MTRRRIGFVVAAALLLAWFLRPSGPPVEPVASVPPTPEPTVRTAPQARPALDMDRFRALEQAADEPAPEPPPEVHGGAVCQLTAATREQSGVVNLAGPYGIYGHRAAWVSGRELHLGVRRASGEAYVHFTGYAPIQLDIIQGPDGPICSPNPVAMVPGEAIVSGTVRNAYGAGQGRVWVEGCGAHAVTEADGSYELSVLPGACEVRAFRQDGVFTARGQPMLVQAGRNDDLELDLVVPEFQTAGLGARVEEIDEGVLLRRVLPGGAAEQGGLRSGDVVVEIEGENVVDLPLGDFVDIALGPEGSDVTLIVLRDGEEIEVTVQRRVMGS